MRELFNSNTPIFRLIFKHLQGYDKTAKINNFEKYTRMKTLLKVVIIKLGTISPEFLRLR